MSSRLGRDPVEGCNSSHATAHVGGGGGAGLWFTR